MDYILSRPRHLWIDQTISLILLPASLQGEGMVPNCELGFDYLGTIVVHRLLLRSRL